MSELDWTADKIILLVVFFVAVLYGLDIASFEDTVVMLLVALCLIGVNIPYRNQNV